MSKDAYVDNMLAMLGMESCKPTSTLMVRKESAANDDQEMLDVFQETPFRLKAQRPRRIGQLWAS